MLILLPPSEGKAVPRRGAPLELSRLHHGQLDAPRREVLDALVSLCREDPARATGVLGLGPTQTDEVRRNAGLPTAATARADSVYTGVLYDALDVATLAPAARRRATQWLRITSSLFGLVAPDDPIPSYRLSGGTRLPGIGVVSAHWRRVLDPVVREAAGTRLVVDLRSTTYAGFWRPGAELAGRVATVRVLHQVGGRRTVVSHANKATKGRMVRALLERGTVPRSPGRLADCLGELGWKVETGPPTAQGVPLDVVVDEL